MDISINKTGDCEATLHVTVPADTVTAIRDDILTSYMQNTRIPGFRPGKAPKNVVAKRYADLVAEELDTRLKSDIQDEALAQDPGLKVLDFGTPQAAVQEDGSYVLDTTLTIVPSFELPQYMGIEVSVPSTSVSDEEVDAALKRHAEASAEHVVVERAATAADVAVIDFKTTMDGKPTAEACVEPVGFLEGREGHWVSLSEDGYLPGLAEGLVGLSAGDSKDIAVTLKEDFPISELAGKELVFSCTVKEVREKRTPEVSPALFDGTLAGKSMEEIREIVRESLKGQKERANDEAKADQVSEKLAEQLDFALPQDLVERENENTVQRKLYSALQVGDYSAYSDTDKLREESMDETRRNLRVYFALQEIARREAIVATDTEMLNAISSMAQQAREKNLKRFIKKLQRENRMQGIRLSIVTSKVLDLLARNAKITFTSPEPAKKAEKAQEAAPEA